MSEPLRVAVTGLGRGDVARALQSAVGIEPLAMGDMEAATRLADGEVSYVVGVCESGGGAALAMTIAVVGADVCVNLSKMGRPIDADRLPGLLADGARAFGVARDHVPLVVPALARALSERAAAGT
ncbi:MAG TPA: DUF2620 family protein [Conexibacter sp.]